MPLNITSDLDASTRTATVQLLGDVDCQTAPRLVAAVTTLLAETTELQNLRFDCTELKFCDSAGLAGLIQIHRQTSAAGIALHLDNRPAFFSRMLDITGVLDYLTAPPTPDERGYAGGASNS